jgi:hypothetical protein
LNYAAIINQVYKNLNSTDFSLTGRLLHLLLNHPPQFVQLSHQSSQVLLLLDWLGLATHYFAFALVPHHLDLRLVIGFSSCLGFLQSFLQKLFVLSQRFILIFFVLKNLGECLQLGLQLLFFTFELFCHPLRLLVDKSQFFFELAVYLVQMHFFLPRQFDLSF